MTADAAGPAGPEPKAAAALSSIVERDLTARVSSAQRRWRSPGVSARGGARRELVWTAHVGAARLGDGADGTGASVAATDSTQFMIGSVTKTFTALAVMALRDAGRLSLDDPLDAHVPGTRHGRFQLRQMLAHASGLQRSRSATSGRA